jgi:serine/threonine protein kinase
MVAEDVFGLVGSTIDGKYRVDALVGEGGFGVVYRGFHLSFEQPIAIKCLKVPGHFTSEARQLFLEKFREEGKHLAKLGEHPSVTRVYDFGATRAARDTLVPYLVLEWLRGRDLEHLLAERAQHGQPTLSEAEAIALVRAAVQALGLAHSQGIAHRDIKPANLFCAETLSGSTIKILDFGIAKAMQEGETATKLATRTSSGFSAFSPGYGAPEQFHSKRYGPTGPWTDVHALGLVLVELVTGRAAYDGEEQAELYEQAVTSERPTPRRRGATVSDDFEQLCAKALAREPAQRFKDARALLHALDAIQGSSWARLVPTALQLPAQRTTSPVVKDAGPTEPDAVSLAGTAAAEFAVAGQPGADGPGAPAPAGRPSPDRAPNPSRRLKMWGGVAAGVAILAGAIATAGMLAIGPSASSTAASSGGGARFVASGTRPPATAAESPGSRAVRTAAHAEGRPSGAQQQPTKPGGSVGPDITVRAVEAVNASTAYVSNEPALAIDGNPATSWSGGGGRPWLELGLRPGTTVDAIELAGGRTDKAFGVVDRWREAGIIARAKITWDAGEGEVTFDRATDRGVRKRVMVGAATRMLRIQVVEVAVGPRGGDADIDELKIFGTTSDPAPPDPSALTARCRSSHTQITFEQGRLSGGSWQLPGQKVHPFLPGKWRMDDGEWHAVWIRYEREIQAAGAPSRESAGTIVRFKAAGQAVDVTVNGEADRVECSRP